MTTTTTTQAQTYLASDAALAWRVWENEADAPEGSSRVRGTITWANDSAGESSEVVGWQWADGSAVVIVGDTTDYVAPDGSSEYGAIIWR